MCQWMESYKGLEDHREREELTKMINIGSCNLHIVHGTFFVQLATNTTQDIKIFHIQIPRLYLMD